MALTYVMDGDVGVLGAVERSNSNLIKRLDSTKEVAVVAISKSPALQTNAMVM
jgi:predicted CoA-binding protein